MVKIKVEKKMNLAELIQYITENEVKDKHYFNDARNACIEVTKNGFINFVNTFKLNDSFTAEIEEEITEITKIPLLLEVYVKSKNVDIDSSLWEYSTISHLKDTRSLAFHMIHSDGTTTLLWTKEGGMVE